MIFNWWLLLFLLVPAAWFLVAKYVLRAEVSVHAVAGVLVVTLLLIIGGQWSVYGAKVKDTEVLNSQVVKKYRDKVSCSHSYECNCVTTTDSKGNTTRSCQTCYEHDYDFDWVLLDGMDNRIEISRVDSQGVREPERFTRAQVGDPVAVEHTYANYIKAVPESLFNVSKGDYERYLASVPAYPGRIYDYHRLDRVLANGVPVKNIGQWNKDLAEALKTLGPHKQANVIVLFTANADAEYAYAVRKKWSGGRKNDIIIVLGCPSYPEVQWVKVFCLTDKNLFAVQLEEELLAGGAAVMADSGAFMALVSKNVMENFQRKRMRDFAYLKAQINMPVSVMVVIGLLSLAAGIVATSMDNQWGWCEPVTRLFRRNNYNGMGRKW